VHWQKAASQCGQLALTSKHSLAIHQWRDECDKKRICPKCHVSGFVSPVVMSHVMRPTKGVTAATSLGHCHPTGPSRATSQCPVNSVEP
jgi:hypothetical protein